MKTYLTFFSSLAIAMIAAALMILAMVGAQHVAAAADASACYNIGDADTRTYCLARMHKEPSLCYAIMKADVKAMCLAETRK